MILDAAETVLGFFGFDRAAHSNFKKNNGEKMEMVWRIKRTESERHTNRDALMLRRDLLYYVWSNQ